MKVTSQSVRCCRRCSWSLSTYRACSYSVSTACAVQLCVQSGRPPCPVSLYTEPPRRTPPHHVSRLAKHPSAAPSCSRARMRLDCEKKTFDSDFRTLSSVLVLRELLLVAVILGVHNAEYVICATCATFPLLKGCVEF